MEFAVRSPPVVTSMMAFPPICPGLPPVPLGQIGHAQSENVSAPANPSQHVDREQGVNQMVDCLARQIELEAELLCRYAATGRSGHRLKQIDRPGRRLNSWLDPGGVFRGSHLRNLTHDTLLTERANRDLAAQKCQILMLQPQKAIAKSNT